MSIAMDLAERIRRHAASAREQNHLFRATLRGRVSAPGFALYLTNVRYLIAQSVRHLTRAEQLSGECGRADLADYFRHKCEEETGHERWADDDREALRGKFGVAIDLEPLVSMRNVVAYIERTIEANPARYLAYILFAEYYTLLAAPDWLAALEARCGIPTSMVSVIAKHVELDRAHVQEGLVEIGRLARVAEAPELVDALDEAMKLWDAFFAEVAEECERRVAA